MEEVLTDSGIVSCDSDTQVGSDIFSDYSQTSTLEAEIMRLKAEVSNKNDQIKILKKCMNEYEHKDTASNTLVDSWKNECSKYRKAYDTVIKLNQILKNNNEILEKSLLNKSSLLDSLREDYDKIYQLKENAEKTLRIIPTTISQKVPKGG